MIKCKPNIAHITEALATIQLSLQFRLGSQQFLYVFAPDIIFTGQKFESNDEIKGNVTVGG